MHLGGFWFEVSWRTDKGRLLQDRRNIDVVDAVRVLDDPGVVILPEDEPGNEAPYRAIGLTPSGRLLTVAMDVAYPDEDEGADGVGILRLYTAWDSSPAERALRQP